MNFKKLRPRVTILKESKVLEALQSEAVEDPPVMQERKRMTTFLQKPERQPPEPRKKPEVPEDTAEPYRVVIKKQPKKSVTERLLEKGLIQPEDVKTPEERSQVIPFSGTQDEEFPDDPDAADPEIPADAGISSSPERVAEKTRGRYFRTCLRALSRKIETGTGLCSRMRDAFWRRLREDEAARCVRDSRIFAPEELVGIAKFVVYGFLPVATFSAIYFCR